MMATPLPVVDEARRAGPATVIPLSTFRQGEMW
jgi:hypothetical protein